jgi:RND family efflux transporter MFP subunit
MSANPEPQGARARIAEAPRTDVEQAWRRFGGAQTPEDFCQAWLELQCQLVGGVKSATVVLQKPGVASFAPLAFWPEGRRDPASLADIAERCLRSGRGILEARPAPGAAERPDYQLAYPVRVDERLCGVIAMEVASRDERYLQAAMRQVQWGAAWVEVLVRRHADPQEMTRQRVKVILQLVAAFLEQPHFRDAASVLATELASRLGCDRAVLALVHRGGVRVEAVSHAAQFDRHANLLVATMSAMTEALDQREPIVYPPERDERVAVTLAHAELAQLSGAGAIATLPLVHDGRQVGALTLERPPGVRFDAPSVELLEGLASMLGPLVDLRRARQRGLVTHAADSTRDFGGRLFGPRHGALKLGALLAAAAAVFLFFAEGTYRISADARIEGKVQRSISAPFAGYVREAYARPGDTVKQGQVLARLDDRDLRVERTRLLAQREQLGQQYREAMSRQERSQVRIVSAQMAQAEAQLSLVEEQLARTEARAPFDGVVVSGDLTRSLGAPLERGQVMFEVAPLDAYRITLQVDERDIADVALGQGGELVLTPMPNQRHRFSVVKLTPVSAPQEGRNLFRVEAELREAPGAALRPGMEGVAKIEVGEHRLAWVWTRRLLDWLALKRWAWLP